MAHSNDEKEDIFHDAVSFAHGRTQAQAGALSTQGRSSPDHRDSSIDSEVSSINGSADGREAPSTERASPANPGDAQATVDSTCLENPTGDANVGNDRRVMDRTERYPSGTVTGAHSTLIAPAKPLVRKNVETLAGERLRRAATAAKVIARFRGINLAKHALAASVYTAPSTTDALCPNCRKLGLTPHHFLTGHGTGPGFYGRKLFGKKYEIDQRADAGCPLCRLVLLSLDYQDISAGTLLGDNDAKCVIYWTVDGRERPDLPRNDDIGLALYPRNLKCTRRLCIVWNVKQHRSKPAYIVLVAASAPSKLGQLSARDSTLFLGRKLTTLDVEPLRLIRKWKDLCEREHHTCKVVPDLKFRQLRTEPDFMVIDVNHNQCTALPPDKEYVALSYTWGTNEDRFTAKRENIQRLRQPGGLLTPTYWSKIPLAIRESLKLTQDLGYRYLWVDAICIIQNNADHLKSNIERMDVVYGNAALTICAADDSNVSVGLCALSQQQHAVQYTRDCRMNTEDPPLELMLSFTPETYIQRSFWNARAWTFQERLLSKRCLIFVKGRVYFQCRTTTMSQDIHSDDEKAGWLVEVHNSPANALTALQEDPISVFRRCLELYTERMLRDRLDILKAFTGISNVVCSALGAKLVWGLPNSHFDWALLWDADRMPQRRLAQDSSLSHTPRDPSASVFPSWSWCGWEGSVGKPLRYSPSIVDGPGEDIQHWLMHHTWITYYITDGGGRLRLVWDPHWQAATSRTQNQTGYTNPYYSHAESPSHNNGSKTPGDVAGAPSVRPGYDYYGRELDNGRYQPLRGRAPNIAQESFELVYDPAHIGVKVLDPGEQRHADSDKQYLRFWTWSAKFHLRQESEQDPFREVSTDDLAQVHHKLRRFAILDVDKDFAGTIAVDPDWAAWENEHALHEFIAISDAKEFTPNEYKEWNYMIEEDRHNAKWQLYNVILLRWDTTTWEKPVAYRAGLGKIYQSAFNSACCDANGKSSRAWKEIILG